MPKHYFHHPGFLWSKIPVIGLSLCHATTGNNALRASELVGLKWSCVKVKGSRTQIEIAPKVSKTASTIRLLPEVAESLAALARINPSGPNDDVFQDRSSSFTRRSLETLISKYSRLADVEGITVGSLRTACIARWIENLSPHEIAVVAGKRLLTTFEAKACLESPHKP